mmetsp:Transcript_22280/g.41418  ORF Transcript_22280/g.41418 Transcript_22280/m.41418 type:complete len:335 (-) Transcript_22280:1926-2930(-)
MGKDSMSPLHVCCSRGDYKALNVLLQSRPSLTQRTLDGKTALEIAETKGFEDICSRLTTLLVSSGTDSTLWQSHGSGASTNRERESENRPRDGRRKKPADQGASAGASSTSGGGRGKSSALPALITGDSSTRKGSNASSSSGGTSSRGGSRGGSRETSSGTGYQLMGQNVASHVDDGNGALRKQLDQEHKNRLSLENKVAALQAHITELRTENATLHMHQEELQESNSSLTDQLDVFKGNNMDSLQTVVDCENMEARLKQSLSAVDKRKSRLMAQEIDKEKESRLCVICQEGEKSVVLFPCRHMCLCESCSQHDDLQQCPLCRRPIVQRISVYS